MAGADGVEKLEDAIVRSAEQVAGQIRPPKKPSPPSFSARNG